MEVNSIVDLREILKIKGIETMPEYDKIKLNIKKLQIIESEQGTKSLDLKDLRKSTKAKNADDSGTTKKQAIEKKADELEADKTIESKEKKFVDDGDF